MSNRLAILLSILGLCPFLVGCPNVYAARATPEQIPDVWVVVAESHWGTLYRLELHADGTGFLSARTLSIEPVHVHHYEVLRWKIENGILDCSLRQIGPATHEVPVKITGTAYPSYLDLTLNERVDARHWQSERVKMVRASDFLRQMDVERQALKELDARAGHGVPQTQEAQ